jgi:staphylococcal nuclease domain-containing protein 1
MFQQLQELTPAEESKTFEPKKGALIAGKFTGDDNWYRAIVTENRSGAAPVKVFYCDFGNGGATQILCPKSLTRILSPDIL